MKNKNKILRIILIILALVPFFYWQEFYLHFYTYLTGTIINSIVINQWQVVLASIVVFSLFLIPLTYKKRAKWVDYSLGIAFFVSLFVEMYGIPLTVLFASKYLFVPGAKLPPNVFEFNLLGAGLAMDHAMVYATVLMVLGMLLIIIGWYSLYNQVKKSGAKFASTGIYRYSRNPQYLGFIILIIGWFIGWPTILTVIFSPILIFKYYRAGIIEEREMLEIYGEEYKKYQNKTPFLL
jgi:protein-S-isoprenylcysteine O-methyltransferase Ste14